MADKILEELRISLKNGLTEAVIKNLVDDLREGGVLNRDETEDILQKTKNRPDQARDLIDSVKVKGREASKRFFSSLENNDKTLYETLTIANRLEALLPKATAPSSARHETTDEQKNEREEYKMESLPRGLCVIINNENFKNPKMKRRGSDFDVVSLQIVFKFLGFVVEKHNDLDANEIKCLMTKYSKDGRHGDCFVCCVLSHGDQYGILGKDEERCTFKDIRSPFDGVNCPSLVNKPKVFFIQACRGSETQKKVLVKTDASGGEPDQESDHVTDDYTIASGSDFLTVMSTVEGCRAMRDPSSGSWFIQSLCQYLKEGSQRSEDILKILIDVNDDVSKKEANVMIDRKIIDAKQIPQPQFTLRKTLIFRVPMAQSTG
ncbi:caspase-22 [Triplophysa dalaica]|uniref:caspase-22 n=1 Tax=Triplophysa dalaica TaxID=1582913 RepID=UPI0024E00A3C|nr:caspase-22 [Triplophysa dalaica]